MKGNYMTENYLTKTEAARELNSSKRTVERLAARRELTPSYVKRGRRRVAIFDPRQVQLLRDTPYFRQPANPKLSAAMEPHAEPPAPTMKELTASLAALAEQLNTVAADLRRFIKGL
jgi:hypothetical protein